jgi:hypothetical protein
LARTIAAMMRGAIAAVLSLAKFTRMSRRLQRPESRRRTDSRDGRHRKPA